MNMRSFSLGLIVGMISTCLFTQWGISAASKEADPKGIPPEAVADYVHSVIQADRTIYTTEVVERMQMRGIVFAAENWREAGKLPLPAQFLIEAGRLVAAEHGSGLRFKLISSWAINKKNRPTSDFERTGLTEILVNPDRPYTGMATEGGTRRSKPCTRIKQCLSPASAAITVMPTARRKISNAGMLWVGFF